MKRPWLAIILAVSLTFNIAFLLGRWMPERRSPDTPAPAPAPAPAAAPELLNTPPPIRLDATQRDAFDRFRRQSQRQEQQAIEAHRQTIQQLWTELARPEPDATRIDSLLRELADQLATLNQDTAKLVLEFLPLLDAEQRRSFLRAARQRNLFKHLNTPPTTEPTTATAREPD